MKLAVIDLGTNTFHLLIVEALPNGQFREIFRKRAFVQLAEEGIQRIGNGAFERGLNTLREYKKVLETHQVEKIQAFGTAALRTAQNGGEFKTAILKETGIEVQVISGDAEARLITKGVRLAVPFDTQVALIMDIGGGSVEFILANDKEVFWARSFPVGVAVLHHQFHKNEPISATEIDATNQHLEELLNPLWAALQKHPAHLLIGASGTFDVLEAMLVEKKEQPLCAFIQEADFYPIYEKIIQMPLDQRLEMDKLPAQRAKLIVVALILIHKVLEHLSVQQIAVSMYAMKEGMLAEMMEEKMRE